MGGEKSTPARDRSGPMNPMSQAPAVRHVNISGIVGCPTGKTSTPIRVPSVRAMSRRMIPVEAPFSSPVRGSFVYIIECIPTRILPACTRSATRGSGTCCASARLANMAVNVKVRSSFFMSASEDSRCAPQANAGARNAGKSRDDWPYFRVRLYLPAHGQATQLACVSKLHRLRPLSQPTEGRLQPGGDVSSWQIVLQNDFAHPSAQD